MPHGLVQRPSFRAYPRRVVAKQSPAGPGRPCKALLGVDGGSRRLGGNQLVLYHDENQTRCSEPILPEHRAVTLCEVADLSMGLAQLTRERTVRHPAASGRLWDDARGALAPPSGQRVLPW
ncbi:hypothetical protein GCM10010191_46780 [Actinomadura vinacea]|uniref:Uncharacterized protein n=1 Tax=Actinomadura vinacea TaxID=115336 RepID=A0ABN3JHC6_9ACTN